MIDAGDLTKYGDYIVKAKGFSTGLCALNFERIPLCNISTLLKNKLVLQILNLQHYHYCIDAYESDRVQILQPGSKITTELTLDGIIPLKDNKRQKDVRFELPKKLDLRGASVYLSAYQSYQMFGDLVIQECGHPNFPYVSDVVRKELEYIQRLREHLTYGRYVGEAGVLVASKREMHVALQLIGNVTPYLTAKTVHGHVRIVGNALQQLKGKILGDVDIKGVERKIQMRQSRGLSFNDLTVKGSITLKDIVLNSEVEADQLVSWKKNGKLIVTENVYYLQSGERKLLKI